MQSGFTAAGSADFITRQEQVDSRFDHVGLAGGIQDRLAQGDLRPKGEGFEQTLYLVGSEGRVGAGKSAIVLCGTYPLGKAFFAFAQAVDHVLRAFRGMDSGGNRDTGEVEEIGVDIICIFACSNPRN